MTKCILVIGHRKSCGQEKQDLLQTLVSFEAFFRFWQAMLQYATQHGMAAGTGVKVNPLKGIINGVVLYHDISNKLPSSCQLIRRVAIF